MANRNVTINFISAGFKAVLNAPGTAACLHEQALRIAGGVSAAPTKTSDFTSHGGNRKMAAVHTRAKTQEAAYEARRELAAAVR